VHYPAISRVVRQAASAHALPYHEQPTLLRAIRSHYRMLKHFGHGAGLQTPLPARFAEDGDNHRNQ
jgi:linoleoyl-CoA desaturase